MAEIPATVKVTRFDILAMQLLLLFRIPANFYILIVAWLVLAAALYSQTAKYGVLAYLTIVTIAALAAFVGTIAFCIILQLVLASERQGTLGPHRFVIGEEWFSEESGGTKTSTNWSAIRKVFRFSSYFFVLISAYRVHIVPKRSFESEQEYLDFTNEIERRASAA